MNIQDIFLNSAGRARSGWRFLIFLIVFVFISLPLNVIAVKFLNNLPAAYSGSVFIRFIVPITATAILAIALGWLCGYLIEDLPFRALGIWFNKNWLKDSIAGFFTGAMSICFAALIAMVFGGLSFQLNHTAETYQINETLLFTAIIFIFGAISEEALFRGFMLQTMSRAQLAWGGIILTSFLFASAHNANPDVSLLSWFNTFLAGVWFAVAYLKTRNLWFPIWLHFAWNWFQGAFLGIRVSGLQELAPAPILQAVDQGPTWLTGGHYGLEGGFACTVALIISTVLIWFLPFLKPTEEMLKLTSEENPKIPHPQIPS